MGAMERLTVDELRQKTPAERAAMIAAGVITEHPDDVQDPRIRALIERERAHTRAMLKTRG